jgi:hypothetical protein
MNFREYVNEDRLDKLQMQMDRINKQLPMMKKMIEKNTKFKVVDMTPGDTSSDPGMDLYSDDSVSDDFSISIPQMGKMVLTNFDGRTFTTVKIGGINDIIEYLKKV